MKMHLFSTGHVKVTDQWQQGQGNSSLQRLLNSLLSNQYTDWLPINCALIEHPEEGLILVDTGINLRTLEPNWFPPYMRLLQRAAPFQFTPEQEIGNLLRSNGLDPADVRKVIFTHLHQDHDGGIHCFPNAEFFVSRAEWQSASGLGGRMGGYFNHLWPDWFQPTLVDFEDGTYRTFAGSHHLVDGIALVPTPGHTAGHLSVIVEQSDHVDFIAGDTSYTEALMLEGVVDGVAYDEAMHHQTLENIQRMAADVPTVYLPCHDPDSATRLENRQFVNIGKTLEKQVIA